MAKTRLKKRNVYIDILDAITAFVLKFGGAAFALVLGYLIYGLISIHKLGELPPDNRDQLLANITTACKLLGVTSVLVVICLSIRYYVEEMLGYMLALLGVVLYFGTPWFFSNWFAKAGPYALRAVGIAANEFQLLGAILFFPGVVLAGRDAVLRIRSALLAKPRRLDTAFVIGEQIELNNDPYQPKVYAKCWQTPYCRQFIRSACPVYGMRKSCWRKKSGCMCDTLIIEKALLSQSSEGRKFMKDLQYRLGQVPGKTELTPAEKRARCRSCVIYEFHQKQKYKIISPLVFPAVIIPAWILYSQIVSLITSVLGMTEKFMHKLSFLPQSASHATPNTAVPEIVLGLFVIWLTIVVISYTLQFIEFCIFKLGI